jgi:transposase
LKGFIPVIDNASYHKIQTDTPPTPNSKKDKMKAWLLEGNISFCDNMLKAQLYDLIKLNKPKHKCYVIGQVLVEKAHAVLRLLPYNPDLNHAELIWADVK